MSAEPPAMQETRLPAKLAPCRPRLCLLELCNPCSRPPLNWVTWANSQFGDHDCLDLAPVSNLLGHVPALLTPHLPLPFDISDPLISDDPEGIMLRERRGRARDFQLEI